MSSSKPKRPSIADFMVKPNAPLANDSAPPAPTFDTSEAPSPNAAKPEAATLSGMFRTSVYFARPVHDKLREIAFTERKTITDLINEGLDHVLSSRNYPTTDELKAKK